MPPTPRLRVAALLICITILLLAAKAEARYQFSTCKSDIQDIIAGNITDRRMRNGTSINPTNIQALFYHGIVRGLDPNATRPITVTYEGCLELCGKDKTGLNDIYKAFAILTTWVLPAVALFSNLPWESLSRDKLKIVEAFTNWIGSPQAALANTMFNVYVIKQCHDRSEVTPDQIVKDAFYVLSCVNQYEYPSYTQTRLRRRWETDTERQVRQRARDKVLLYGLYRPLTRVYSGHYLPRDDIKDTRILLSNLAYQLRMYRRRGVYPQSINILWFLVAFVISLVTAFADLGDNTTAHSLALGLLLSWLPVLITMMIVDRNPSASTRCRVLIERWLYNVNYIYCEHHRQGSDSAPHGARDLRYTDWWKPSIQSDALDLCIGDFVGQGRRLRYCGIANAILSRTAEWSYEEEQLGTQYDKALSDFKKKALERRPPSWWAIWISAQLIVSTSAFMGFMVSFNTPTIGLGCRSFMILLWWILSSVSWIVQFFYQEPPRYTLVVTIPFNSFSATLLFIIMLFQVTNGLNNCLCKSSIFGTSSYGGYLDFETAQFYKDHFHVVRYWAPAAAFGMFSALSAILWALRKWSVSDSLWHAQEDPKKPAEQDDRNDGRVSLDWLI